MKYFISILSGLFLSVGLYAASSSALTNTQGVTNMRFSSTNAIKEFTLEELAKYNGKNNMPAYVAVDGVVYDETGVAAWLGGMHKGYSAGQDITEWIKNKSPHGLKVLANRKVVGKLVTKPSSSVATTNRGKVK